MSRVRKGKKLRKLLAAAARQPVKPPSRPPPKRKTPASQKGAKKSSSNRNTPQKHSFASSLAVRTKPSKAPPPASYFAGEWSHIRNCVQEKARDIDESFAGTPDSASHDSSEDDEPEAQNGALFSKAGTTFGANDLLESDSEEEPGIIYDGETHRGYKAMKAENLIEIEEKMELRARDIIDSARQPRDRDGKLKNEIGWDIRLLRNLRGVVMLCQDVTKINALLARQVGLRVARGDQRHYRVGHGAMADVLRRLHEHEPQEREEVE